MKHDFRQQPDGEDADRFLAWLEQETIRYLRLCLGDWEATKGAVFLYANRAYEAHMPEDQIGDLFGKSFVRAGWAEEDEATAFDLLEYFGQIAEARQRHKDDNPKIPDSK